jgi:CheY-like chemotaxis protein
VAHGIVHGHDGVILAESWPGEGTCMRVVLPATAEAVEQEPARGIADGNRPTEGKRILYVDDEESLVLLVGRWLGRYGHEVRGYTDAHSALRALQDGASFDLLVTDLAMPGMSGFDVAADALRLRPGLPVIMMSGYVTAADRARGLEMGIRELLLKPARIDELAAIIARHLDA